MVRVPDVRIRELCGVEKRVDKGTDLIILSWFGHIDRIENDKIAKKVYVGERVGRHLVGRLRKRWIDSVNDCLKKRGLNIGQTRRMVYYRNEWQEFVRGNAWGIAWRMNP